MSGKEEVATKFPPFNELRTSTQTTMVYTNIRFSRSTIFKRIKIAQNLQISYTKKKKYVDRKTSKLPYGAIVSAAYHGKIRGPDTRRKPECACILCGKKEDEKKIARQYVKEGADKYGAKEIWIHCSKCGKDYSVTDPALKVGNKRAGIGFPYQVTIVISLGGNSFINIMLFDTNFKITGGRTLNESAEAVMILWEDYIRPLEGAWRFRSGVPKDQVRFEFAVAMCNLHFLIGYDIDRERLNILMNDKKYKDKVIMAEYEATGTASVKVRMRYDEDEEEFSSEKAELSNKPKLEEKYDVLVYPKKGMKSPHFETVNELAFRRKKKPKKKKITFIVFATSETILSGRIDASVKTRYEFFMTEMMKNREYLEEKYE